MKQSAQPNDKPDVLELSDLRTISGLVAENPEVLKESVLRWQLRHRQETGLAQYCVAVGKNILISKTGYEHWLAKQAGKVISRRRRVGGC